MFVGPVFTREFTIAPRRTRTYASRWLYGAALLVLIVTAWLVLAGTQRVRDPGDFARFGMSLFQVLAPLQLAVAVFFSGVLAASAVAQEKDRRTLDLLLMTKLSNSELVLGKMLASLLNMLMLVATALPIFMVIALFGGVAFGQIARAFAVTVASVVVCGSLGSTLALWREKTYQALAMTLLGLVLWLALWRIVAMGAFGSGWLRLSAENWAAAFSPWEAILEASRPYVQADPALGILGTPVNLFVLLAVLAAVALNGFAIAMVRVWNPSREMHGVRQEDETWHRVSIWGAEHDAAQQGEKPAGAAPATASASTAQKDRVRHVWDNPVIWREIVTWAYGRRIVVIRLAYLVLFALAAGGLGAIVFQGQPVTRTAAVTMLGPLFLLSLVLVNAQAVTAITSERDARALDLLLVSDLSPKEIVYGKLGGIFFNTKEMILLPMLLCGFLWYAGTLGTGSRGLENLVYLTAGLAILYAFVAMLGLHAGMMYDNSRAAIATSLGTVFFLFLGVATCMWIMVAFSGSFGAQLQPFLVFMGGGGVGLYAALGVRNPSVAIGVASFLTPFATFFAITSFFLSQTLGVFLVVLAAYGFMTAAMLVPAIYEFDVATGRTTVGEG